MGSGFREYAEPDSYLKNNGEKSVLISLEMQSGNNIVDFGKVVSESMTTMRTKLPGDVTIGTIADMPGAVGHSVDHFLMEFLIAIVAVATMLFLRVATVVGVTIPISILMPIRPKVTPIDLMVADLQLLTLPNVR
ncbi:efflux RND transporter permease subunit [Arsenicibacter rosenii]|uniref:Uncharacterized protein n=1 Tax=Arsenicibacter rosenii TaxID=1750698 RepID=A0A1S2VEZ3_9BACT|nr:efflux RND transporter permease subunit [Arsenicibacter rosenii]OIN57279.1 hypothetical protein BLX24_20050 [Arsenicibacter rosenii]